MLKAENNFPANSESIPTHETIPLPPVVKNKSDHIFVSLETYLGKNIGGNPKIRDTLTLSSNRDKLILRDMNGILHKSSQIQIDWELLPKENPIKIFRKVLGPFASYESAKEIALKLSEKNISSLIARPGDWEVWVSKKERIPKNFKFKVIEKINKFEVQPLLKIGESGFLMKGPIEIKAPSGLLWKGGLYFGPFLLQKDAYGTWTLIEKVKLKKYLGGVVQHEIGSSAPKSAKEAQAVLARTWALANISRFNVDGYHLCSDTQCQVYKDPEKSHESVIGAINSTSGKYLVYEGKPINAVYHATNGGVMAGLDEAWLVSPVPYLTAKIDANYQLKERFKLPFVEDSQVSLFLTTTDNIYGSFHKRFRWKRLITNTNIINMLLDNSINFDSISDIKVMRRGASGRVLQLKIIAKNSKESLILKADEIRKILIELPSTLFVVSKKGDNSWEFSGGGFGHGVGLSQAGAIELSKRGWNVDKILSHYYPGTEYESLP